MRVWRCRASKAASKWTKILHMSHVKAMQLINGATKWQLLITIKAVDSTSDKHNTMLNIRKTYQTNTITQQFQSFYRCATVNWLSFEGHADMFTCR